jgi:hypothetical protein
MRQGIKLLDIVALTEDCCAPDAFEVNLQIIMDALSPVWR